MPSEGQSRGQAIFAPGLPVEVGDARWWRRVGQTLVAVVFRANRSFCAVEEPVRHGPALSFIASLRLPTWGVLVILGLADWLTGPADSEGPIAVTAATRLLGLQLGQVVAAWSVIMIPLRIPVVYFVVGLCGHMIMTLTGGAHRSIGASMRAMGYALAPVTMLWGALELALHIDVVSPEVWLYTFATSAVFGLIVAAIALARTHGATVFRALFVSLIPVVIFCADGYAGALLQLPYDPVVGPPPPSEYFVPLAPP